MSKVPDKEIIKLLTPIIKKELTQTDSQNREDLEQEILLKILIYLRKTDFKELPSFFQLVEEEFSEYSTFKKY